MKKVLVLSILVAAVLMFANVAAAPQPTYHCVAPSEFSFKTEGGGSYRAPEGCVIESIYVKASTQCFPLPNACYEIVAGGVGQSFVEVVDVANGGDCHDLSHIEGFYTCPLPTDTPEPTPTDTPDPTETPTEPTPTPTDTLEDPTPTPTSTPEEPTPTPTDVPPTPTATPPDHPPTGPYDSAVDNWVEQWINDPVMVGGMIFIGLMLVAMGLIHLWEHKIGIG